MPPSVLEEWLTHSDFQEVRGYFLLKQKDDKAKQQDGKKELSSADYDAMLDKYLATGQLEQEDDL